MAQGFKGAIFDVDGVLVDSPHEQAWRDAYSWRSIGRRLWRSRTHTATAVPANLGYRFYARRLHRFYTCDWFIGQETPPRRLAA